VPMTILSLLSCDLAWQRCRKAVAARGGVVAYITRLIGETATIYLTST
jgi:hypothetical protein